MPVTVYFNLFFILKNSIFLFIISNIAHSAQEPIFITKNGYSDLVVMSSELYDKFARINRIDQAIYESEQEILNGAEAIDANIVFAELEKKYFG